LQKKTKKTARRKLLKVVCKTKAATMAGNAESIILEEEIDENYEPSQEGERAFQ
jgi:hypothetical protein